MVISFVLPQEHITDSSNLTIFQLTIFQLQLHDSVKVILIQQKLYFEF